MKQTNANNRGYLIWYFTVFVRAGPTLASPPYPVLGAARSGKSIREPGQYLERSFECWVLDWLGVFVLLLRANTRNLTTAGQLEKQTQPTGPHVTFFTRIPGTNSTRNYWFSLIVCLERFKGMISNYFFLVQYLSIVCDDISVWTDRAEVAVSQTLGRHLWRPSGGPGRLGGVARLIFTALFKSIWTSPAPHLSSFYKLNLTNVSPTVHRYSVRQ